MTTKRYPQFPGGWYGFFTLILVFLIPAMFLYFDSMASGGSANPITFGFVTVVTVIVLSGLSGMKGLIKGFGLKTDPLTAVGLICTGAGLGFLIFTGLTSFSILLSATLPNLSQALVHFLYDPFATQTMGGTTFSSLATQSATSSLLFIIIYMGTISFLETCLRVGAWKAGSNWLGSISNLSEESIAIIILGLASFLWAVLHYFSLGAGLVAFLPMAIIFGTVVFIIPFMIYEHVIAPGGKFDLDSYRSWGEISLHFHWNLLVSAGTIGITLGLLTRIGIGAVLLIIGVGIMLYKTFGS